ncbi:MAG TPA: H-X9-DG-CTERM domain-containing protein [Armatimonadota bacterium]|jgi:prepilin-type processing-associated H-X9-DG protein
MYRVLILALALTLGAPLLAGAQPPPVAGPVAGADATAVARQFVDAAHGMMRANGDPAGLGAFFTEKPADRGGPTELFGGIAGLMSVWGLQNQVMMVQGEGKTEVDFQLNPVRLVMTKVNGEWRIDAAASFALLPPEMQKMMQGPEQAKAEQNDCMSNLKQIMLGALMYANDHGQRLPDAAKWMDELMPYVKNELIFKDPAAPELAYGYAMNVAFSGVKLDTLALPAETVIFFDSALGTRNAAGGAAAVALRHNGGANYAFADGHCKWDRAPLVKDAPKPTEQGAGGPPPPG